MIEVHRKEGAKVERILMTLLIRASLRAGVVQVQALYHANVSGCKRQQNPFYHTKPGSNARYKVFSFAIKIPPKFFFLISDFADPTEAQRAVEISEISVTSLHQCVAPQSARIGGTCALCARP